MGRRVITAKDVEMIKASGEDFKRDFIITGAEEKISTVQPDDFKTKLIKYIPAEIVAAFVTVDGIMRSVAEPPIKAYWVLFFLLFVFTPLYMWRVTTEQGKPPAKVQILVSTISFAVWVFALGGPFSYLGWYKPMYGALLLPVYTVAIPIIVGRDS